MTPSAQRYHILTPRTNKRPTRPSTIPGVPGQWTYLRCSRPQRIREHHEFRPQALPGIVLDSCHDG